MREKIFLLLMGVALAGFAADKAFLIRFHKALVESLPPSFEAELQGGPIEKKLATLPKDMIQSGRKAGVRIVYRRLQGVKLEVTGLTTEGKELYGDIFQPYMKVFTLGPLLLSAPTDKTWENYTLTTVAEDEKSVVLSLVPKNTANEYLLFIDKVNMRLQRLDFKGSGFLTSTIVKFTQRGEYWIPEVFLNKTIMEDGTENLPDRYQLVNIKIAKE
ncbi:MAG: hypothetical protein N2314_06630 [Brevinematales bacterium]|nr:hypothetical protein [Brevinematales bacterium]